MPLRQSTPSSPEVTKMKRKNLTLSTNGSDLQKEDNPVCLGVTLDIIGHILYFKDNFIFLEFFAHLGPLKG